MGGSSLVSGPTFCCSTVQYATIDWRSLGKGLGVQLTKQASITCTLKIGPLYPEINMNKWAFVLLSIAAIVTVIGLGIWIPVALCCKCVASQLVMGYKAQGVCACAFTICIHTENQPTHIYVVIL